MPSDYTGFLKILYDWQTLITGGAAILGGWIAYRAGMIQATATRRAAQTQVEAEQQREEHETDALRKSLATEIRQLIARALGAHESLKRLVTTATPGSPITARMVESSSRVPNAVVYPSSAPKIGRLGGSDATDIVIIYNLIEIAREGAAELIRGRMPENIPPRNVAAVADAFLKACQYARGVFPRFRTAFALHDNRDHAFIQTVNEATAAWDAILQNWPKAEGDPST